MSSLESAAKTFPRSGAMTMPATCGIFRSPITFMRRVSKTTIFPSVKTTYQVSITNSTCKQSKSLTAVVDIKPAPQITLSKSNNVDCNTPEAQLQTVGGISYIWSPPTDINNIRIANPVVNPVQDTWYKVSVTGNNGCAAEDSILVKSSIANANGNFYVPNAFTPNGDGVNDVFRPIPIGMKQINYFKVYDRWGQLMFSTTQQNAGWDGTFKGHPQDPAVFVWIAGGVDYQDKKITQKGTVTLIR